MYLKYNYKEKKRDSEIYEHELHELKKQYRYLKKDELLNLYAALVKYVGALEDQNSLLKRESSLLRSLMEKMEKIEKMDCKTNSLFPLVKNTSTKPLKKPSIIIQLPVAK